MIALFGALAGCSNDPVTNDTAGPSLEATAPDACDGKQVTGRDYGILEEAVMRTAPDKAAPPIIQPGKTQSGKDALVFATVDGSVPVREVCRSGEWSNIRVLAPQYLRWMRGWIPARSLRRVDVGGEGRRIYTAADIEWQAGSERYRKQILDVVNAIQRDDKRCDAVDTDSLLVKPSNAGTSFAIACVGPADTYPIDFTAADASNGRSFAVTLEQEGRGKSTMSKVDAVVACEAATRPRLAQPGSADYHTFTDVMFSETSTGARVRIGVTAKNGLGFETAVAAHCEFTGSELISASIEQ